MRLLNTKSLDFTEFFDSDVPKYAILSHRWGSQEVGFKEMRKRTAPRGPGLRKIKQCCRLAASRGLRWVWIDTCCIDKRSSAELSEAINSMYRWYERSSECYVYLADFQLSPRELSDKISLGVFERYGGTEWLAQKESFKQRFSDSLWFTRGWTLQELLAPEDPIFYDAEWNRIGGCKDLGPEISTATRIPESQFDLKFLSSPASVATKMSFAAHRITSREEDIAYCLLGLFDVAMPLLYGEGAFNAFQRLQIEIMRKVPDESIFAWTSDEPASGMLAPTPSCFANSSEICNFNQHFRRVFRRPFAMSNIGLDFPVPTHLPHKGIIPVYLNCGKSRYSGQTKTLCIQLRVDDDIAYRIRCHLLDPIEYPQCYNQCEARDLHHEMQSTRTVYVRQPDHLEHKYSRLRARIEEGELRLIDVPWIATAEPGETFMNLGPVPIAADSSGRFMNSGDGSPEAEARAEMSTHNALMKTVRIGMPDVSWGKPNMDFTRSSLQSTLQWLVAFGGPQKLDI